jgi:hypothetical protein
MEIGKPETEELVLPRRIEIAEPTPVPEPKPVEAPVEVPA